MFIPIWDTCYSRLYVNHRPVKVGHGVLGTTPIVGTIASNVRPIDRLAVKTRSKGTLAPILKWANAIGDAWVESTVRSYRKGVK